MKISELNLLSTLTGEEKIPSSDSSGANQPVGISLNQVKEFCNSSGEEIILDYTFNDYAQLEVLSVDETNRVLEIRQPTAEELEKFRDQSYPYEVTGVTHYRVGVSFIAGSGLSGMNTTILSNNRTRRLYFIDDTHVFLSNTETNDGTDYVGDGIAITSRLAFTSTNIAKVKITSLVHRADIPVIDLAPWQHVKVISTGLLVFAQSRYSGCATQISRVGVSGTENFCGGMDDCNYQTLSGECRHYISADLYNLDNSCIKEVHTTILGMSGTSTNMVVLSDLQQTVVSDSNFSSFYPFGIRSGGNYNTYCAPDAKFIIIGISKK